MTFDEWLATDPELRRRVLREARHLSDEALVALRDAYEAGRAEGTRAERERCMAIVRTTAAMPIPASSVSAGWVVACMQIAKTIEVQAPATGADGEAS